MMATQIRGSFDDAEVQASTARQDYYRAWPLWRAKALKRG